MPFLTIYKLRPRISGASATQADDFVDFEDRTVDSYGPVVGPGFRATLYVTAVPPHAPRWAAFLQEGFGAGATVPSISSAGALVIVELQRKQPRFFAMPFGTAGRFLLRQDAFESAYGVRAALNLIYPTQAPEGSSQSRLVGVDAKRHGLDTLRTRFQSSRGTTPEAFDLDELRDVLNAATGRPLDTERWGTRVSGRDGLSAAPAISFEDIGRLCRDVEAAHRRTDYRERFAWLDHIQPVADPEENERLDAHLVEMLKHSDLSELDIAPPEIVVWEEIDDFQYSSERKRGIRHPELRLPDLLSTLQEELAELTRERLLAIRVRALNRDGNRVHEWRAWRCLTGSFQLAGKTYILDEGSYFAVSTNFLEDIDGYVDGIPSGVILPSFELGQDETKFNEMVSLALPGSLLMHEKLIPTEQPGSRVELCDILTPAGALIHVKRELGSRDLSHLLSQGFVSAALLQEIDFREAVRQRIIELAPESGLADLFPATGLSTANFNICFAVVADRRRRTLSQALPFFAKVNLRRTIRDLKNRGFGYSWTQVQGPSAAMAGKPKRKRGARAART